MNPAEIISAFGFVRPQTPESLYAYAPVFRVRDERGDWVLKRTGLVHSAGEAIGGWLRALQARGVAVVAPAPGFGQNPRLLDGVSWVVYPFVAGEAYRGSRVQIAAAGKLLGHMHAANVLEARALKHVPLVRRERAWILEHADKAPAELAQADPDFLNSIEARLATVQAADLDDAALPLVGGSFDFKAANLVYATPHRPVLIDPDHAARLPRLADLAVALLLFHCDYPGAPHRLWTPQEWQVFGQAYARQILFTPEERAAWPGVLAAAWLDQAVWLLGNFPEGWADPQERAYLLALARADLSMYVLPD